MKLADKGCLITGGSRGIGKAVAKAFLTAGARVIIAGRSQSALDAAVEELGSLGPIQGIRADVSKQKDVELLVEKAAAPPGTIDVLVNAAAIQKPIGPFLETDMADWIRCLQIDLIGTALCCKAVLPSMVQRESGRIINFAGGGSTSPRPNFTAYACAKTAVVRFTETLALEVAPYGISVNAISPGAVHTRMLDETLAAGPKAGAAELEEVRRLVQGAATPPEVAAALALHLASAPSPRVTGRLISAVWDDWKGLDGPSKAAETSSLYTLRRIDGRHFVETGKK